MIVGENLIKVHCHASEGERHFFGMERGEKPRDNHLREEEDGEHKKICLGRLQGKSNQRYWKEGLGYEAFSAAYPAWTSWRLVTVRRGHQVEKGWQGPGKKKTVKEAI